MNSYQKQSKNLRSLCVSNMYGCVNDDAQPSHLYFLILLCVSWNESKKITVIIDGNACNWNNTVFNSQYVFAIHFD